MARLTLAPWKYRDLLEAENPVFRRISAQKISMNENEPTFRYEAYAHLQDRLRPGWLSESSLYGNPDGTGTSKYRSQACYKAISEAIERWAFYELADSSSSLRLGFKIEPSTTGMAAFPGVTSRPAREIAMHEAIERWSVCAWWEGILPARRINQVGRNVLEILHPWLFEGHRGKSERVIVIWSEKKGLSDPFTYAFSCAPTIGAAVGHASDEMYRSKVALNRALEGKKLSSGDPAVNSIERTMDRRLVFFSTESGREKFLTRVRASVEASDPCNVVPPLLVDQELPGPWSSYAHVWRVLFEMPSSSHLSTAVDYFYF